MKSKRDCKPYWRPQVVLKEGLYGIHEVHFDKKHNFEMVTVNRLTPGFDSVAKLKEFIDEKYKAKKGVVVGESGYSYYKADMIMWLNHIHEHPWDYDTEKQIVE